MKATIEKRPLPAGMSNDDEARLVDGWVVVAASLKGEGWWVRASGRCGVCHGSGWARRIVHNEMVIEGPDGKKKVARESEEVEGPCDCVMALCLREEQRRSIGGGIQAAPAPKPLPVPPSELNLKRRERILAEIVREEEKLHAAEMARAAAMAPHLAYQAAAERRIGITLETAEVAEATIENCEAAVACAEEEWHIAGDMLASAMTNLAETKLALADITAALARFRVDATKAAEGAERAGAKHGYRHRIDTQKRRLRDLRDRLADVDKKLSEAVAA